MGKVVLDLEKVNHGKRSFVEALGLTMEDAEEVKRELERAVEECDKLSEVMCRAVERLEGNKAALAIFLLGVRAGYTMGYITCLKNLALLSLGCTADTPRPQ